MQPAYKVTCSGVGNQASHIYRSMSSSTQNWRPQADTADLKEFGELLRRQNRGQSDSGTLHAKSLLARLAFRGMLEQGASEQEIADALGTTPERVHLLKQQCFGEGLLLT
jgi:lambda repressor-like predicted transcriptional regulator